MSLFERTTPTSAYCTLTAGSSRSPPPCELRVNRETSRPAARRCRCILRASAVTFQATRARSTRLASVGASRRTLRQSPWLKITCVRRASSEHWRAITSAIAGADGNSTIAETGRRYVASVLELGPGLCVEKPGLEGGVSGRGNERVGTRGRACPKSKR